MGNTLDREDFKEMRREFYDLKGWDPETGLQRNEILERLDPSEKVTRPFDEGDPGLLRRKSP